MRLPDGFEFSQSCLQDYLDCPRRFWLRHIEQRSWPAELTQPALEQELRMQAGQAFHNLVQQYLCGIPSERLNLFVRGDELQRWWSSFLEAQPAEIAGDRYTEFTLAAPVGYCRLVAKYDLIVISPEGQATILDWKTGRKKPFRDRLAVHAQTRVYPYLLCRAGARLAGGNRIPPENIRMIYWFAEAPGQMEIFEYNADLFARDEVYLTRTIQEITGAAGLDDFPQSSRAKTCEPCVYRSYCTRGITAPQVSSLEDDWGDSEVGSGFNFDDVPEIAF